MASVANQTHSDSEAQASSWELVGLTVVFGFLGGCFFALYDVLRHAPNIAAIDALIAIGFAGGVGMVVLLAVGASMLVVSWMTHWTRPRPVCAAILTGAMVMAVAAAIIIVGAKNLNNIKGLLLLLVAAPLFAIGAGLFVLRLKWLGRPSVALVVVFAAIQSLIIGLCGAVALRAWTHTAIVGVAWAAILLVGFLMLALRARRSPSRVGCILALCLPVSATIIAWLGGTSGNILGAPSAVEQTKPNVVMIVLDTTRRDYLGCYGDSNGLTPGLDRIATEGVVYDDAISAAPWTVPSHASIFTGLYPVSHGCSFEHRLWLHDHFTTLAEVLGSNGYQTVALSSNIYLDACNMLQGFEYRRELAGAYDGLTLHDLARYTGIPNHWADKGSAEACAEFATWIQAEHDPDRPLFLFVNLLEPHRPYLPPMAERDASLDGEGNYLSATSLSTKFDHFLAHAKRKHDPDASKIMRRLYRAELKYQDRRLSEMLDLLGRAINLDQTLLIITSDHGENIGEAGRWEHLFDINDTLIHVPLIIRFPEHFPAGSRVSGLCQTIDLASTIYDLLGIDQPKLPGRTLVPDKFVAREAAYAQTSPFYPMLGPLDVQLGFARGSIKLRGHLRALRTDRYKFVSSSEGVRELYDIVHDPFEATNLCNVMPEEAARLEKRLEQWWTSQPAFERRASADEIADQDELIRQLRSLGYIQ